VRRLVAIACVAAVSAGASGARADVTTWLAFGTGLAVDHSKVTGVTNWNETVSASMGVGSDPTKRWVLGGIFRTNSRFNEGTDLSLSFRITTGGFSRGDWGLALDVGPGLRLWSNNEFGTYPLQGVFTFGLPWGMQIAAGADIVNLQGKPESLGGYAIFEFDLMRFSLLRQGSTDTWWELENPAGGRLHE
jgi:hypothetical protein